MAINLTIPNNNETPNLKPRITVVGVGGAGGNAVNNMIEAQLEGVNFVVANTDSQALASAKTDQRVQMGLTVTQGLGAGSRPEIGRQAAEESMEEILSHIDGSNMVFVTAGMGGGTGTGAAPIIAQAAQERGILTVGVVTRPFSFEGRNRMSIADSGIAELQGVVDTQIVIPNQNLFRIADENTTFADAFKMADNVLHQGVRSITDLMIMPGLINLDFADIKTVMAKMGKAMMGTGEAEGERRGTEAAEAAISNPLLEATSIEGARGMLISVTGGMDMTLFEVDEAATFIRDKVDGDANIIFGATFDESLQGKLRVSVVATGLEGQAAPMPESSDKRQTPRFFDSLAKPATIADSESDPDSEPVEQPDSDVETVSITDLDPAAEMTPELSADEESPSVEPMVAAPELETEPEVEPVEEPAPEPVASPAAETGETSIPLSLFERVTGTGRVKPSLKTVTHLKPTPQKTGDQNPESKHEASAGDDKQQPLDIPAFLRRRNK